MDGKAERQVISRGNGDAQHVMEAWPLTIAEAHESIGRPLGYTTIQTRLNRLVEKGIVDRTEDRPAKYVAAVTSESVSAQPLGCFGTASLRRECGSLVAQLVEDRDLSKQEISELKKIIADAEKRSQSK